MIPTDIQPTSLRLARLQTPLGAMLVVTDEQGRVAALDFQSHEDRFTRLWRRFWSEATLCEASGPSLVAERLDAYFSGDLNALDALPVILSGTPFQRQVWMALRAIPAGHTQSYAELACTIGAPKAVRAVGLANGANPIGIIVPCHRVIGSDGSLVGYGGGLERKAWLLAHEGARHAGRQMRLLL
jgi:methylated-DNA-[protein]-cysteine S-methyltransferase